MRELRRVGGDGILNKLLAFGGNRVSEVAAQTATNLRRESGEKGLISGHTRSNAITGFSTTFFAETSLKSASFTNDSREK